jgi:small subunit ribosomal protein S6
MVRDYELMYIVRPDVDEDGLRAAIDSVKALVEGQGGEVRKTTNWGKRRLAYEVKHLRDGHYVIVEMRLDGGKVAEIERALRIHDQVFRHLLVVQEEPSADTGEEGEGEEGATAIAPPPDAGADAETETAPAASLDDEPADLPSDDELEAAGVGRTDSDEEE